MEPCRLVGLRGRADLNGSRAIIVGPEGDRLRVRVAATGEEFAVRKENVGAPTWTDTARTPRRRHARLPTIRAASSRAVVTIRGGGVR